MTAALCDYAANPWSTSIFGFEDAPWNKAHIALYARALELFESSLR